MSFQEIGYRADNLVRLDIRINYEDAPPLATIVHRDRAHDKGKAVCHKLKELIPRQQFRVSVLYSWLLYGFSVGACMGFYMLVELGKPILRTIFVG